MVQAVFQGDPWPRELGECGVTIGALEPGKRGKHGDAALVVEAQELGKVLVTLTTAEVLTVAGQALESLIDLNVEEVAGMPTEKLVKALVKDIKRLSKEEEDDE